jgi:hypothetical protein
MSDFNKLTANRGLKKDDADDSGQADKDVRQMIVVRGIQIPLDEVSPPCKHAGTPLQREHSDTPAPKLI